MIDAFSIRVSLRTCESWETDFAVWHTSYDPDWQVTFARARALELRMYLVVIDTQRSRAFAVDPDGAVICGTFDGYEIASFSYDPVRTAQTLVAPGTDIRLGLERAAAACVSRRALAAAAALVLLGTAAHRTRHVTGSFKLSIPSGPFISGSRLPISASGVSGALTLSLIGPGKIEHGEFIAPLVDRATTTTLIAAARAALATATITVVPPPAKGRALIAVAAYESGIALHDPKTFALIGYMPIGGPPGDVAFSNSGALFTPDTDGDTLTRVERSPWDMSTVDGVAAGNEVAIEQRTGNVFVSNRDVNGSGALTRIAPDGTVTRVSTGDTAEGLAIDSARGSVYVGNVNDATVAQIDAGSMTVTRKIRSVDRTFGIALDDRRRRLYVVSNTSPTHARGRRFCRCDRPAQPALANRRAQ